MDKIKFINIFYMHINFSTISDFLEYVRKKDLFKFKKNL